ncbi:unnamed protein product [Jaminaea pallidilutea]
MLSDFQARLCDVSTGRALPELPTTAAIGQESSPDLSFLSPDVRKDARARMRQGAVKVKPETRLVVFFRALEDHKKSLETSAGSISSSHKAKGGAHSGMSVSSDSDVYVQISIDNRAVQLDWTPRSGGELPAWSASSNEDGAQGVDTSSFEPISNESSSSCDKARLCRAVKASRGFGRIDFAPVRKSTSCLVVLWRVPHGDHKVSLHETEPAVIFRFEIEINDSDAQDEKRASMESVTSRMDAAEHSRERKGISGFLSRFVSYKRGSPSFAAIEADTSRPASTAQHPKNRRWSIATGLDARAKMAATISKDQEQANHDSAAATDTTLNDPASTMPATAAVLAKVAASVITPLQAGSQSLRRKRRTATFASPENKLSRVEVLQNIEEKTEPSSTPSGKSQDDSSRSQKTGQGGDEKRPVSTRSNTQSPPLQSYFDDGNGGEKPNSLRLDLGQPLVPSSDDRKDDVSPERVKCDVGEYHETHQASGAPSGDETAVPSTPRPIGLPRRSAVRHTRSVSATTDSETHKPTKSLAEGLPTCANLCQEQKERTKSEGGADVTSQPRVVCVTFPALDGNLLDSKVKGASEEADKSLQTQNGAAFHAVLPESSKLGKVTRIHCPSAALESLTDIQELRLVYSRLDEQHRELESRVRSSLLDALELERIKWLEGIQTKTNEVAELRRYLLHRQGQEPEYFDQQTSPLVGPRCIVASAPASLLADSGNSDEGTSSKPQRG